MPPIQPGSPGHVSASEMLQALCELMKEHGIAAYVVPSEDAHSSEYASNCDERRSWLSVFFGERWNHAHDSGKGPVVGGCALLSAGRQAARFRCRLGSDGFEQQQAKPAVKIARVSREGGFLVALIRTFGGIPTVYRACTILDVVNLGA